MFRGLEERGGYRGSVGGVRLGRGIEWKSRAGFLPSLASVFEVIWSDPAVLARSVSRATHRRARTPLAPASPLRRCTFPSTLECTSPRCLEIKELLGWSFEHGGKLTRGRGTWRSPRVYGSSSSHSLARKMAPSLPLETLHTIFGPHPSRASPAATDDLPQSSWQYADAMQLETARSAASYDAFRKGLFLRILHDMLRHFNHPSPLFLRFPFLSLVHLTLSCGVATYDDGQSVESLIFYLAAFPAHAQNHHRQGATFLRGFGTLAPRPTLDH